jgi:5-methylcytosine-specific restriction endonuclease McrA
MPKRAAAWDDWPKRKDAEGRWLCRWCGVPLKGSRNTSFCGTACRAEVEIRCQPAIARYHVGLRDKGVCARCGLDTEILAKLADEIDRRVRRNYDRGSHAATFWHRVGVAILSQFEARGFNATHGILFGLRVGALWEADHILPVVEGGGGCGLENYRTLCTPCHKKETAKLAARRKNVRRGQLPLTEVSA